MIQTYPNHLDQYQVIGLGAIQSYHGVYTEISYEINQYDIAVDNGIIDVVVDNGITELLIR